MQLWTTPYVFLGSLCTTWTKFKCCSSIFIVLWNKIGGRALLSYRNCWYNCLQDFSQLSEYNCGLWATADQGGCWTGAKCRLAASMAKDELFSAALQVLATTILGWWWTKMSNTNRCRGRKDAGEWRMNTLNMVCSIGGGEICAQVTVTFLWQCKVVLE